MSTCRHCPDGHTPPTRGSQPWSAWVAPERDGDGQPMQITVARSAGAHVAESDAEWMREVLNSRRCPSCDHEAQFHDSDGRCWFTCASGLPETNLVCPCKVRKEDPE